MHDLDDQNNCSLIVFLKDFKLKGKSWVVCCLIIILCEDRDPEIV